MDLIDIGASFDWIGPIWAIVQDLAHGPHYTFLIPDDCGWSGRDVAKLLRKRGIETWGHMVVNGSIMLTVKRGQIQRAQRLFRRAGIPTENAPPQRQRQDEPPWWSPFT